MSKQVSRRDVLKQLGLTMSVTGLGVAGVGTTGFFAGPRLAQAAMQPKGKIPNKPFKTGHISFQTGAAALLGEPGRKGHILAAAGG